MIQPNKVVWRHNLQETSGKTPPCKELIRLQSISKTTSGSLLGNFDHSKGSKLSKSDFKITFSNLPKRRRKSHSGPTAGKADLKVK